MIQRAKIYRRSSRLHPPEQKQVSYALWEALRQQRIDEGSYNGENVRWAFPNQLTSALVAIRTMDFQEWWYYV